MTRYKDILSYNEAQVISVFRRFWKLRHTRKKRWAVNSKLRQMISLIRKHRQEGVR